MFIEQFSYISIFQNISVLMLESSHVRSIKNGGAGGSMNKCCLKGL